jgi:hypothetical protein
MILVFVIVTISSTGLALADGPPVFVTKWGSGGTGNGQFNYPRGITVTDSFVYVTEQDGDRVQKFTLGGDFLAKWGSTGGGDGQFNYPLGITTDAEGNVYVVDHLNHRVQKFTSDGGFILKWGSKGSSDGQLSKPLDAAVDPNGDIWVSQSDGARIQKFTNTGVFLTKLNGTEGGGPGFYRPWGVTTDAEGHIYVAEYGGNRVRKLESDGTLIHIWGGTYGTEDGQFKAPCGISLDKVGNIYVADHENHRIQKFTNDGQFITKWGTHGVGDGQFAWVSDVAVDEENYFYTADYINQRVQKFVYPAAIKVTAQVRAEHDDGPFVTPTPPLVGATVRLSIDGDEFEGITGEDGVAGFPVTRSSSGQYEVRLEGPSYDVKVDHWWPWPDFDPPTQSVTMEGAQDTTEYTWPHGTDLEDGPAIQAAYFIERFRREYLRDVLGFKWTLPTRAGKSDNSVAIEIHQFDNLWNDLENLQGAGVFDGQQGLRFLRNRSEESDVVYHEFMHCVISDRTSLFIPGRGGLVNTEKDEGNAMDEGLADYFAASYTNDSVMVRCGWPRTSPCTPLRDLTKKVLYPTSCDYDYDRYEGSHILSGSLWEMRTSIITADSARMWTTDSLVFAALDKMLVTKMDKSDPDFFFKDFYDALKQVDSTRGGEFSSQIDAAFASHNVGVGTVPYCPLAWDQNNGLTTVNEIGDESIELFWSPIEEAMSYSVLINTVDYGEAQGPGLGSFVPIATGLTDTTYVFSERDSLVEYLFSVVAVDSTGQQGYRALPVLVEPRVATGLREDTRISPVPVAGRFLFNTPNPFNPETRIVFELTKEDDVTLTVYDVSGRKVRNFASKRFSLGRHHVAWDGTDDRGTQVSSGPYFVLLKGSSWKDSGKVLLLK